VWTWGEKSGDPRVAVAVNESEPKYLIADMNGRPTLYFDSTNYLYTTDGTLADFTVTTSNETAFFMTRMYDNGNDRGGWFGKADALLGFQNDNDRYFLHSDSGSASAAESAPTADTIVVYHRDAADDKTDVYENGVRVLHNLPNAPGNLAGMNAIARINDRNIWGEIAEILLYDRPLSDDEMYSVGKYLSLKYGLKTAYIRGTVIVVR
jgi:hypothetical protein